MTNKASLTALILLLREEVNTLSEQVNLVPLRVLDAAVRDIESDIERVRQGLDELLRVGEDAGGAGGAGP